MCYENEEPKLNILAWVFKMFRGDEDFRVPTPVGYLVLSADRVNRLGHQFCVCSDRLTL